MSHSDKSKNDVVTTLINKYYYDPDRHCPTCKGKGKLSGMGGRDDCHDCNATGYKFKWGIIHDGSWQ